MGTQSTLCLHNLHLFIMLNRFRVSTRLGLSFASLLLLFTLLTGLAVEALREAVADYHHSQIQSDNASTAMQWAAATQLNVNRVLGIAHSGKAAAVDGHFGPLIAKTTEDITAFQKTLDKQITDPKAVEAFKAVGEARTAYIAQRKEYFDILDKDLVAAKKALTTGLAPAAETYMARQASFVEVLEAIRIQDAKNTENKATKAITILVVLVSLSFVISGLVAWRMVVSITTPINKAVAASKRISDGDLSQNIVVVCQDEFGMLLRSMQHMQESLRGVVKDIRYASDNLVNSSAEIANGGVDLSSRTEEAAASLEETAASMEQLTATVHQSAQTSRLANQMATEAAQAAGKGGSAMQSVAGKMVDIETSGKRIVSIIGAIDEIAFQTNILALNAAVEAARAGEQGRGFAVVASEVRNLAKRSADAAKEIKGLIEASVSDIQDGSRQVQAAKTTMDAVVHSVKQVSEMVAQITISTGEQSNGLAQVNQAVAQLDQATQQNAALVEESGAAAEGLREQASRLGDVVAVFRVA